MLHRLLTAFVRRCAAGTEAGDAAQAAVEETLLREAHRLNNAGYPAPLLSWQPHLRAVTDAAFKRSLAGAGDDEQTAGLCNALSYHLDMIGDYAGARPLYKRALAIRERALGPDHPDTAQSLNNLGMLLQAMGDIPAARPYLERALGPGHPDTQRSRQSLAAIE